MRHGARVIVTLRGILLGDGEGSLAIDTENGAVIVFHPEDNAEIREACPGCEDGDWQSEACDECKRRGIDAWDEDEPEDYERAVDDGGRDSIIRLR